MNIEIVLWVGGALLSVIGVLALIVLKDVKQQGADTNKKVTHQGELMARMDENHKEHGRRIGALETWRSSELERQISDLRSKAK